MPPKLPNDKTGNTRFRIGTFDTTNVGERIILYGEGGSGKSTLASLAPSPIFIPLSDGAREISRDGNPLPVLDGVESFQDLRDAITTPNLFDDFRTIVIDDGTELEHLGEQHVLDTFTTERGKSVKTMEGFGWGKGFVYLTETMRLLKADLEQLSYQDKHIVLICHMSIVKIGTADEFDYLQAGPKLYHGSNGKASVRDEFYGWATQVVQIDFMGRQVTPDADKKDPTKDASFGRVDSDQTRAIYTEKHAAYLRKSRNLNRSKKPLPPVVSFENIGDDSFWQFIEGKVG